MKKPIRDICDSTFAQFLSPKHVKKHRQKSLFSDATLELVSAVSFEQIYSGLLNNTPLLIIIRAEIESEVLAQ